MLEFLLLLCTGVQEGVGLMPTVAAGVVDMGRKVECENKSVGKSELPDIPFLLAAVVPAVATVASAPHAVAGKVQLKEEGEGRDDAPEEGDEREGGEDSDSEAESDDIGAELLMVRRGSTAILLLLALLSVMRRENAAIVSWTCPPCSGRLMDSSFF